MKPNLVITEDSNAGYDFFTAVLRAKTQDTYLRYSKSNLNKSYLSEKNKSAILKEIEGIDFKE